MLTSCAGAVTAQQGSPSTSTPTVTPAITYVNVRDYGAVGDGMHDDSPAILAAVNAAISGQIRTVEFPPTAGYYHLASPLNLPTHSTGWIRLCLDGPLSLSATLTVESFYSIYGNSSQVQGQFAPDSQTLITVAPNVNPGIHIVGDDVKLDNLNVYFNLGGTGDGILTDGVNTITLTNVSVLGQSGRDGVDVHITGQGFDYIFDKGVYENEGLAPTFQIDSPSNGGGFGFVAMRDVSLAGRGIHLNAFTQAINFSFENILYEAGQDAFLTINGTTRSFSPVYDVYLKDIIVADPPTPAPPLITNNNAFTSDVQVLNSLVYSTVVSGDPISDLEIWAGGNCDVGQPINYILHEPFGIVSTMPVVPASARVRTSSTAPFSVRKF
jgi:hypothetical protein